MWLLIDDERNLNTEAVARTAEAGRKLLAVGGGGGSVSVLTTISEKATADMMFWCGGISHNYIPSRVQLVTANPVGRKNMQDALVSAGWSTRDGINFKRY